MCKEILSSVLRGLMEHEAQTLNNAQLANLEVLYKRDSWVFDSEVYVSTEVFEIVLESVINIYEGYVNLKRM